jgi:hypothetical protein
MFLLDLPFVATGVHVMVPFWPELTLLWTAWLTFPMTAGARLITEAAAPRVAGWSARADVGAAARSRAPRANRRQRTSRAEPSARFRSSSRSAVSGACWTGARTGRCAAYSGV